MDESTPAMIEAKGLSKYFGAFVAIEDISFTIPKGQIVAFLGPNGAGKSTTMKILTGFLAPSKGTAAIAGLDIQHDRIEASRKLGYLPENGPLYMDMTPVESLKFFGEAREMEADYLQERIDWVTRQCALEEVLEKPVGKLSKGYRQRVGLAQSLLHDPEVLVLDEPTAGLDPNQIRVFRQLLRDLATRKTILISTHILREVEATADRVLLVDAGRMIYDGSPENLREAGSLEQPFYRLTNYGRPRGAATLASRIADPEPAESQSAPSEPSGPNIVAEAEEESAPGKTQAGSERGGVE